MLDDFKKGKNKVLIATDVTARGIDIPHIDYVVNYDLPEQAENYVHRVGRTGRGKERGRALTFCSKKERDLLKEIESYITVPIKRADVDKSEYKETILFSDDGSNSWKDLIAKDEEMKKKKRKKRKKGGSR